MVDRRLKKADFRPKRADFRPEKADFRLARADFRPARADSKPERAEFRPERTDFRSERPNALWTELKINFPCPISTFSHFFCFSSFFSSTYDKIQNFNLRGHCLHTKTTF